MSKKNTALFVSVPPSSCSSAGITSEEVLYWQDEKAYLKFPSLDKYEKIRWGNGRGDRCELDLYGLRGCSQAALFRMMLAQDDTFIDRYKGHVLRLFMMQFIAIKDFASLAICLKMLIDVEDEKRILEAEVVFSKALDNNSLQTLDAAIEAVYFISHLGDDFVASLLLSALNDSTLMQGVSLLLPNYIRSLVEEVGVAAKSEPAFEVVERIVIYNIALALSKRLSFEEFSNLLGREQLNLREYPEVLSKLICVSPIKFCLSLLADIQKNYPSNAYLENALMQRIYHSFKGGVALLTW